MDGLTTRAIYYQLLDFYQLQVELWGPFKWPYKWVSGVITLLIGVITTLITGGGPPCTIRWAFFDESQVGSGNPAVRKHQQISNSAASFSYRVTYNIKNPTINSKGHQVY